jgi:hypothetical protein
MGFMSPAVAMRWRLSVSRGGLDPQRRSYGSYVSFSDPDGTGWFIQEVKQRARGR